MAEDKPITAQQQPKFAGIKTYMRLPHSQTMQGIDFAVAGIPWDGATSYRTGQRLGPDAIRKISVTLRPYNFAEDIGIFEHCSGVDYGDLSVVPGYIEDTYDKIEAELGPLIETGVIPVVMGGDHSITLAELRATAKTHGPVSLIHFDSHTDTNDHIRNFIVDCIEKEKRKIAEKVINYLIIYFDGFIKSRNSPFSGFPPAREK